MSNILLAWSLRSEPSFQKDGSRRSEFFGVQPEVGETIGKKGKSLRGSYLVEDDNHYCEAHQAIMLVSAYIVERGYNW